MTTNFGAVALGLVVALLLFVARPARAAVA